MSKESDVERRKRLKKAIIAKTKEDKAKREQAAQSEANDEGL